MTWSILWRKNGDFDAHLEHGDCLPVLFRTRREAKAHIDEHYSYIRTRVDLRRPPHNWRMPIPVRISVTPEVNE